jgi:hypothetical protein
MPERDVPERPVTDEDFAALPILDLDAWSAAATRRVIADEPWPERDVEPLTDSPEETDG